MFTGLIKDVGEIVSINENAEGKIFKIKTKLIHEIGIDDSVAVNGCCLTATEVFGDEFLVQAVHVTLQKTAIGALEKGSQVNLELAMRLSDRLGGHLVQGHVNGVGSLVEISNQGENFHLWFELDQKLLKYIILEGSIAISGISLTVANIESNKVMVTIIPHTWKNTNFSQLKTKDLVNIEVDMMAKYLENFQKYANKEIK
jgi:riboflavin synthase